MRCLLVVWMFVVGVLGGQTPMTAPDGGAIHLFPTDATALDLAEPLSAFPCVVRAAKPELRFDLSFRIRFTADVKLREIAGDGNQLTSTFRVFPEGSPEKAIYFQQKWRVPPLPGNASGETSLDGAFRVGEGDYQVDWMMRDRHERVCSSHWRISTRMPVKDGPVRAGLPPGAVAAMSRELGRTAEPRQTFGRQIDLTVLLNVSPSKSANARSEEQTEVLLATLRAIVVDPRVGTVTLLAFRLDQRKVIFEQEAFDPCQIAALEQAIEALPSGTVSVSQLAERDAEARFLVRLAAEQAQRRPSQALLFVGARMLDETALTRDLLKELGEARSPVFYLMYSPARDWSAWQDVVGSLAKHWRGREFTITEPLDLIAAWSKIMAQLAAPNALSRLGR